MSDFGCFLSSEELGPTEMLRFGQAAEAVGFERLWLSDHYHSWLLS
jgi:alkanesulfonate monooxygenase SsuD/methylene tetrahydromethanopterin reductase-like flavin-dependent oxidoreductase (luciferase family)